MPNKIHAFASAPTTPMMDTQKAVVHANPLNADGSAFVGPLPGGGVPSYSASDASVTLQPAADGMTCDALGVKGVAGTPTVLISFTNPDGTVATGSAPFIITVNAPPVDVADFGVTVDPPVAQ